MKRVLIIVAHPALHRSRINAQLMTTAAQQEHTEIVDLYNTYPDFEIDISAQQDRLAATDIIVFQHPMYWYSTPALLKEYVDLVFSHGFAYGEGTKKLAGKVLTQAVSMGGDAQSFHSDGFNRFTVAELLRPMEATAHFCGMRWLAPFVTHGGHTIQDHEITAASEHYGAWLQQLIGGQIPLKESI